MIAERGVTPDLIGALSGAAGGPKWLILSALDQYLFGDWLTHADHEIALVGSSIGAWRFAAACERRDPAAAIRQLERAYLHGQRYSARPDRDEITAVLRGLLEWFFSAAVLDGVLNHPRYRSERDHRALARADAQ